jgi:hypothetical protein
MALNRVDRHDPVVRILEMSPGLLGLDPAGALHQHARDDLETVGDPMLHLLQQDRLLANEIVLLPSLGASKRDVGYRQQEADVVRNPIFELARVQHQGSSCLAHSNEVDLIGRDLGAPGRGGSQQGRELWQCPFASAEIGKRSPGNARRVDLKDAAERRARRDHREIRCEEKQGFVGAGDDRQSTGGFDVERGWERHRLALKGRQLSERKP